MIHDNVSDFTSSDARETGAKTAPTMVAPTNEKIHVRKVPQKSPYQSIVIESCQGNGEGVNDSKPSNFHLAYQSRDKSLPSSNNENTVSTDIGVTNLNEIDNIPVKCHTSDLDTSVQTQDATVGDFNKEEVVPLG